MLGLTAAYELVSRGHQATLVDREGPLAGASHRSFAWLNANNKFPSSYHRLNAFGIEEHDRLQERLPDATAWLHLNGSILADFSDARRDTYATRLESAQAEGYPVREAHREDLAALEPSIGWPQELDGGLYYPGEGYLDTDIFAEELVRALAAAGAHLERREVERVESSAAGAVVVTTDGERGSFDRVVLAAGAWSRQLGENSEFTIPVADLSAASTRTHSLLGLTVPTDIGLRRVLISDRINVRPRHDGRMWVQVPHVEQRVAEGESPRLLAEVAATMKGELEWLFERPVPVEKVWFSGRSLPEDGLSIMGFVDEEQKVYCMVTHSGMTLAALLGRLAAEELAGQASELLGDFRPARFKDGIPEFADCDFIGRQ
ncbi:FAD-binding oxidoreductase [Brevibacterium daeguense]|uniref:FAD-binding oxidoreductase n=1 Tax=Brevibacterium daeguense TaxID=909936 RepID=A0ABP8EK73_9MICO